MIQELIDETLGEKNDHVSSGKWKPSALGQCYRRHYWARKGEEPSNPIDKRTLRVFKAGNLFHDFVQTNLLTRYPNWQKEVKIEVEDVLGYADLVSDNEVVDIKSQHSRKFWWNDKEIKAGKDIKDMFFNNWLQVMWYAWSLGKERARLVFVSKDDLCIQEFSLPLDGYWKGLLDEEFTKLNYYWKENQLPPAQPRLYGGEETKKECGLCNYKTKCFDKQKGVTNGK